MWSVLWKIWCTLFIDGSRRMIQVNTLWWKGAIPGPRTGPRLSLSILSMGNPKKSLQLGLSILSIGNSKKKVYTKANAIKFPQVTMMILNLWLKIIADNHLRSLKSAWNPKNGGLEDYCPTGFMDFFDDNLRYGMPTKLFNRLSFSLKDDRNPTVYFPLNNVGDNIAIIEILPLIIMYYQNIYNSPTQRRRQEVIYYLKDFSKVGC